MSQAQEREPHHDRVGPLPVGSGGACAARVDQVDYIGWM